MPDPQNQESETVTCRGVTHKLLPGVFYHLAYSESTLLWNARLSEGLVPSVSLTATAEGLENVTTFYHAGSAQDPKELLWEEIRQVEFPYRPSRRKALFLFDELNVARLAQKVWFPNETRYLLKSRVVLPSLVHRADTRWLDTYEHQWQSAARNYWFGVMTDDPFPEVIVHGMAYFPDWKEPPFGILGGIEVNPNERNE